MNIWKLAAGVAPALALFAGTADAQLCPSGTDCPVTGSCSPDALQFSTTAGNPNYTDSIGPAIAPFPASQLSVDQFDPAAIAALPQHAGVDPNDITLLNAQVRLSGSLSGQVFFDNRNPNTGCQVNWTFNVDVELEPNVALGTPALPVSLQAAGVAPLSPADSTDCPDQSEYEFMDQMGPEMNSDCLCESANLAPWTGNGVITWDLNTLAQDNDTSPCGAICKIYDNLTEVTVEVVYTYCIEDEPPPPPIGCVCNEPSPHYRKPGSLLLFPEFDNREGDLTLFTITNTDCVGDDVDVELIFIDHEDCGEFNTTITLTPCDTFTAITNAVNPNMEQGYFYAFAKDENGDPITHNGLIGSSMTISGIESFDYSINPVSFMGMTADGALTDLDDDGIRDLDGAEYEPAPDTITIPRFLGQGVDSNQAGDVDSRLILIGLSGGQDFDTTICFDVYNDNEEGFSGEYTFFCWEKPTLLEVRGTFANAFLKSTDHDENEILGYPRRESGWICIDGCFASSTQETIADPAFYAVLVEHISNYSASDLPFECGRQSNGALLPRGLLGDGDPNPVNGDNQ